jgi:hypothetical protein
MTLLTFGLAVVLCGIVFYLVDRFIPMSAPFKTVIRIVAVLVAIFLILALFNVVNLPFRLN